jgi:hemerythrin
MITKRDHIDDVAGPEAAQIVIWGDKYATGIALIDKQHRELVVLTNELYQACLGRSDLVETAFKNAMSRMVEYVRFHFSEELELLQRIKYPDYAEHKRQHENLIKDILEAANEYKEGRKFVPNHFVRTLKDWVFGHIAVSDKIYSAYVHEQKKKGLLNDKLING